MLRKFSQVLALSISLTISLPLGAAANTTFSFLGSLSAKLNATMNSCPERLWPDYNWKNVNVLSYEGPGRAYIWRGETGLVSDIDPQIVLAHLGKTLYSFATIEGRDSVLVNMMTKETPPSIYQILDVILHEGFHHFAQSSWKRHATPRGTVFPLEAEPRLYRKMLFQRLQEHFLSEGQDQKALAQAAFWMKKWREKAPQEITASTDGYEGTAKYVGSMGALLASRGCDLPERDFLNYAKKYAQNNMGHSLTGQHFSLDREGYDIGGLSAMTLRFLSKNQTWYQEVAQGATPTEILLRDVIPLPDAVTSNREFFTQTAANLNAQYAEILGNTLEDITSTASARVVPSFQSYIGAYQPVAFILPKVFPHLSVVPMASERFFQMNNEQVTSNPGAIFISGEQTPCSQGYQWLEVPISMLSFKEGKLSSSHSSLTGSVSARHVVDRNGKHWYCLFE